ncbi:MAG TPA: hypothetical protein VJO12_13575, partial [Stellaceae bacterium]|nr:hypothetical protein [Stellaceae bacterium]
QRRIVDGAARPHARGDGAPCRAGRRARPRHPGRFGWDGGYGTSTYMDPTEDMVAILMTQRLFDSPSGPAVLGDFWTSVYQAIDD